VKVISKCVVIDATRDLHVQEMKMPTIPELPGINKNLCFMGWKIGVVQTCIRCGCRDCQ
jgi:hypothetical protein